MHYQDWQTKHPPRVDKFVKFVLECLREADQPDRNGRPMLIHDELVNTHEHNMSLFLSIHLSIHLPIHFFISLCLCLCLCFCLSLSLSLSLPLYPSMYPSFHPSINSSIHFSINVDGLMNG